MSFVSGVTLICSSAERGPVGHWLDQAVLGAHDAGGRGWISWFEQVADQYGGYKHPQCAVWGSGLNYLNEKDFVSRVLARPWDYPENVVLVVQREGDAGTKVFRPPGY